MSNARWAVALSLSVAALSAGAAPAQAFCGFYVGGADTKLFNNATMVVLMREGTRTVLSMQNNYQGPPADFALVVPVPVVLQKENVKTLPRELFDRVDALAAPRLVEYWEQDPCRPPQPVYAPSASASPASAATEMPSDRGVRIEAKFSVGEYDVLVLSAQDSGGLDAWLRENHYKIPEGAEPILRPYVAHDMKFFVAKVDVTKVKFENGQAMLSPLRFYYDSDTFSLPVRLGLLNSAGTQDLVVHVLAHDQRYEVANYPNVTIPTNYDVAEGARAEFGAFYAALFDKTLAKTPGAVVTEYAWDASTCDPCPGPTLDGDDLATLGADALVQGGPGFATAPNLPPAPRRTNASFTLTRLHARYGKDALGEDLVFRAAPPIEGGREDYGVQQQQHGARPSSMNNFQGRYAIRHPWTGPVSCSSPQRGVWGGPPAGQQGDMTAVPVKKVAFAPRGSIDLASMLRQDVPELGLVAKARAADATKAGERGVASCGRCAVGAESSGRVSSTLAALVALLAALRRRRR